MTVSTSAGVCASGTLTASFSSASPTSSFSSAGPIVRSVSPGTASAGQPVTVSGVNFGATQGASYLVFADINVGWGAPLDQATFRIDSWSDDSITFTVPTPSGSGGTWHVSPGTTATIMVMTADGGISNGAKLTVASG
jgi:glucan 1,6-alpha-isomaltosidase